MSVKPQLVLKVRPFDFEAIRLRGEQAAIANVASFSNAELCSSQMELIDWGSAFLTLQVPKLRPDEAVESVHDHEGYAVHCLEVPFDDPSGIASLINPPELTAGLGCDIDLERNVLCVSGYFGPDDPADGANTELAHILSAYRHHIELTARHLERFNAALPNILSVMVEDRLNELSEIAAGCALGETLPARPEAELV